MSALGDGCPFESRTFLSNSLKTKHFRIKLFAVYIIPRTGDPVTIRISRSCFI